MHADYGQSRPAEAETEADTPNTAMGLDQTQDYRTATAASVAYPLRDGHAPVGPRAFLQLFRKVTLQKAA